MLSRREVIAGGLATLAASPFPARAQTSARGAAGPTILRLERRDIGVKPRRSTASASRTGLSDSRPSSASLFAFASKTALRSRA
jgi:hypothetical protein